MIHTAFAAPNRTLTAKITIDGIVYGPEAIASIRFNRGVSLADKFEIGTAYAQVVSFELIDEDGTLLQGKTFLDKVAKVELGVLDGASTVYKNMGDYILEAPEKTQKTLWRFDGTDAMVKADVPFTDDLTYPLTISAIFQAAVMQMGATTDTVVFPNSTVSVEKPNYYEMSIREVLADVAELAAGYCFMEDGNVRIRSIVQDATTSVTGENMVNFRRNEDKNILIDQLIIRQTGTLDHTEGTGSHPYYIQDNVFIQGDPQNFAPAIFTALNGTAFVPCEVEFNGNPTEILNGWVNVDFLGTIYKVFPTSREISFTGGMKERWISKPLANKPPDPVKENLVRTIRKNLAQILVMDDKINAKVSDTELTDAMQELSSEIGMTANQIFTEVARSYVSGTDLDGFRTEIASKFLQTAESFGLSFTTLTESIKTVDGKSTSEFNTLKNNILFAQEELVPGSGNWTPKITLGSTSNEMQLVIRSNKISFMQGTSEVAYISNNKLYITDGHFINTMQIGNFAFKPRTNGSLSFGKV